VIKGFLQSTLFSKTLVALTGAVLVGFLIAHLSGNLLLYLGADTFNAYGQSLKDMPAVVWGARFILLIAIVIHIYATITLTNLNKNAKPIGYAKPQYVSTKFSGRMMFIAGITILAFVIYHLPHYTLGWIQPEYFSFKDSMDRHDIYTMTVMGFRNPIISLFYIVAMLGVGVHLHHGIRSMFQTMGIYGEEINKKIEKVSLAITILVTFGFISIPISVLVGIIGKSVNL